MTKPYGPEAHPGLPAGQGAVKKPSSSSQPIVPVYPQRDLSITGQRGAAEDVRTAPCGLRGMVVWAKSVLHAQVSSCSGGVGARGHA